MAIVRKLLMSFLCLVPVFTVAEAFELYIGKTTVAVLPQVVEKVVEALELAGFTPNVTALPEERSIMLVNSGEGAMDGVRFGNAIVGYDNLHRLDTEVYWIEGFLVVHRARKEVCQYPNDQLFQLNLAGVRGVKILEEVLYRNFPKRVSADTMVNAMKMVMTERADITLTAAEHWNLVPNDMKKLLVMCREPYLREPLYSYIHTDYLWAKERLEAAYRQVFSQE